MSRSSNNPVIPPRPEMPYMGSPSGHGTTGRPPPPPERTFSAASSGSNSNTPTNSSKTPVRKDPPPIPPHPDVDWAEKEELRTRELEEARARAAQMEKTMRWWSDCTANWREKWSKVRNERNKARDECRQLRSKLEASVKESTTAKRERNELRAELAKLRKVLEQTQSATGSIATGTIVLESGKDVKNVRDLPDVSVCSSESHKSAGSDQDIAAAVSNNDALEQKRDSTSSTNTATALPLGGGQEDFVSKLLSRKEKDNLSSSSSHSDKSEKRRTRKDQEAAVSEDILVQQKLSMLQLKLDETLKTLQAEREEKNDLVKSMDEMQEEIGDMKTQYEGLKASNEVAIKQLSRVQEEHASQVGEMAAELEDESTRGNSMDRRLADLRKELERLQQENAQEWCARERLETEKLSLDREVKKQRKEIEELAGEVERKNQQAAALVDQDLKAAQGELAERNKELSDLRHAHSKLKKSLAEKTAELDHARSRAEQYEAEVRKLRGRIDELKRELTTAEDEADQQSHQVRKLQRNNEELQQQVDNLSVQVQHLQTRLLRSGGPSISGTRTATIKSLEVTDSASDGLTDEDEHA